MSKQNNKKPDSRALLVILILAMVAAIAAVMLRTFLPQQPDAPVQKPPRTTAAPVGAETSAAAVTEQQTTVPMEQDLPYILNHGLEILDTGKYTGAYMEDGSDEVLSDVMMIVVRNSGDADIQLAEIALTCSGTEFRFALTNLPVGAQAVVLDQDRRTSVSGRITDAALGNVALFQESMECLEERIEVGGLEGMLNVQNISGRDITGDICIYYKYAVDDLYYGGITFRVRIEGGLKADEIRQIPAGHYNPESCAVVQVTIYE